MVRSGDLDQVALVLVDGDNLLHDVRGSRDEGGIAWLLPRLRTWLPDGVQLVVTLDGHPAPGDPFRRRVSRGIDFQHSGGRSGDDLIVDLLTARPFIERAAAVVVTRDRGLQARARRAGGQTRSTDWFMRQLEGHAFEPRPGKPGRIGAGRPVQPPAAAPRESDEEDREPWRPGRGATRKRGNPRRAAKPSHRR